jgi:hypothetical protein
MALVIFSISLLPGDRGLAVCWLLFRVVLMLGFKGGCWVVELFLLASGGIRLFDCRLGLLVAVGLFFRLLDLGQLIVVIAGDRKGLVTMGWEIIDVSVVGCCMALVICSISLLAGGIDAFGGGEPERLKTPLDRELSHISNGLTDGWLVLSWEGDGGGGLLRLG